jgi:hypothetical protein
LHMKKRDWLACVITLAVLTVGRAGAETICMEAESALSNVAPVQVISAAMGAAQDPALKEASGGSYIDIPDGVGKPPDVGGEAVYSFDVKVAGDYVFWGRAWWADSCGNSFTLVLDQGKPFEFGGDGTYKSWHWVKGMKANLSAGAHTLRIQNREDGVKLDEFLFTGDPKFVPVGAEEPTAGKKE